MQIPIRIAASTQREREGTIALTGGEGGGGVKAFSISNTCATPSAIKLADNANDAM